MVPDPGYAHQNLVKKTDRKERFGWPITLFLKPSIMKASKNRICRQCGEELYGRRDKRFCSDYCRATFNNQEYYATRKSIRSIIRAILRNRNLLNQLHNAGYAFIPKTDLAALGFNFKYFTSIEYKPDGRMHIICLDHGYSIDANEMIELSDGVLADEPPILPQKKIPQPEL